MYHLRDRPVRPIRPLAAATIALGVLAAVLLGSLVPPAARATAAPAARPAAVTADAVPNPLRVGTEGVYAPFSYHDAQGKLTGFDVHLMDAVAKKLGVQVQYVETPWDSMFAALGANRFDIVANQVTKTEDRARLYTLSDPYIETTGVLVVKKGNDSIRTIADLKGKRAAENLTSNWSQIARDAGATIVGVDGMTEAIANLTQGRVDAIVNDKLAVRNYLATNPDADIEIVAETGDTSESVYAAKKDVTWMPAVNTALAQLKADGTIQKIYDQYFTAKPTKPSTWELVKDNLGPMLKATVVATIPLTVISFAVGLVIALLVALGRMSRNLLLSGIARFYISVIRGTPLLVQLVIIFYALPSLGIRIPPFPSAVIALSLNVGGYAAEVIRSAIQSIPRGQWEAGETIGMDYRTTLRRIIIPQAARTAVPPLSNTLISLVKDTSLASAILVVELFRQAQIAAAPTFQFLPLYTVAALYYWVICLVLSFLQSRTETRLNRFVAA
ncbi:Glutamine-binding periplasmic protein/glutamine transport system permease protein [Nostocoides japonicum T1-X7]|uniref:Glutamine-binding periplasmic protein/glutamine transport system permease protein n=2 Tax=Nostocoides japonicum TaxID=99481 RepID=A0A077LZ01_9MICO|nr:Glutamine-binding periplasmic protein/glutamine transport system permease protein [Tetrasphaera japonica T1-X7]